MTRLYLASTSPRRREILRAAGIPFTLLHPEPDPPIPANVTDPTRLAIAHARHKALSTRPSAEKSVGRTLLSENALIIGVDTIVVLERKILGKPRDREDARQMIESLSGRTHRVISGLAVHTTGTRNTRTTAEQTLVTFRRLGRAEIEHYLDSEEPYDKAGAYGIQGRAGSFIAGLQGSYLNVVGLPLARLLTMLS